MDPSASPPQYQTNPQIAVDLFISKRGGGLMFADASGNLVFKVNPQSNKSTLPHPRRVLLDSLGASVITLHRNTAGSWQGFRGHDGEEKDLIFRVERTLNTFKRAEFEVFLVGENWEDSKSDFKMKGCPFQRSCTICRGNSILAQVSCNESYVNICKYRTRKIIFKFFTSALVDRSCHFEPVSQPKVVALLYIYIYIHIHIYFLLFDNVHSKC